MSLYDELSAEARGLFTRVDQVYAAANKFPERFRRAMAAHLKAPADLIQLRGRADTGPAWKWPLLTRLGADDVDPDYHFTFAITTVLNPGCGETAPIASIVTFKPIRDGFDGFILQRSHDGSLDKAKSDRFEIHNEEGWDGAVEL